MPIITKEMVLDCMEILDYIRQKGLANTNEYNEHVKPMLETFKNKHGDTPNIILNNFMKKYLKSKGLGEIFKTKGFPIWGRRAINKSVWACIFKNILGDYSISPQLHITIKSNLIKFGLGYGQYYLDNAGSILASKPNLEYKNKSVRQNDSNLKLYDSGDNGISISDNLNTFEKIKSVRQNDPNLKLYDSDYNEILASDNLNGFEKIRILKEYTKDEIPEKIEESITTTFDSLINIFKDISDVENKEDIMDSKEDDEMSRVVKSPVNVILYGPPGTGKTHNTIDEAMKIIDSSFYEDVDALEKNEKRKKLRKKFNEYKEKNQIEMITFHQSYSYEDFIEGIRADASNQLTYRIVDGIFKDISKRALKNLENSGSINNKKNFEDVFKKVILDKLNKVSGLEIETKNSHFKITEVTGKSIHFDKFNGKSKHSLSIDTLSKMYKNGKNNLIIGGLEIYYNSILEMLLDNSNPSGTKEELKNYVLIIDEINRGNISKIFGELITLIEDNKRVGNDEELKVTLPYSGKLFGVPKNLYIIGTMNTADRSIALLDTALRRRFEFIEMMPDLDCLDGKIVDDIKLDKFLEVINKRIEYLYDRDHTIGHAYFINVNSIEDLNNVMKNNVIPLLQEYFYDDWEKIQIVLGDHDKQITEPNFDPADKFIVSEERTEKNILGSDFDDLEPKLFHYTVNPNFTKKSYLKVSEFRVD